ncbi:hypothetical protein [Marinitoga sp. 1154]|nr:hypothetical protein [Marinitoga sp. 1154]
MAIEKPNLSINTIIRGLNHFFSLNLNTEIRIAPIINQIKLEELERKII